MTVTQRLSGRLDMDHCATLANDLGAQIRNSDLHLDLSGIDAADSAALALFLELLRQSRSSGHRLTLSALPAALSSLAHLYEMDNLLTSLVER
ncbi:STAS domain-containing protein [Paludibacterium yongneupense]|uniref:STAS domain-containing protein n=1 Tax=Paludibacterium yongneupense TaxID=400061 RepID=UPI00056C385A|nr:STAS domain-containing protein [Paludibacterium yongneupense]